jgi:glycosyltransferase involved in cell wall biosynthesis
MNKGILQAKGEYLQFLNSGDWLVNEEVLRKIFKTDINEDVIYGDVIWWYDEKNSKLVTFESTKIDLQFFFRNSFPHQATFTKRKLFDNELFDENLKIVSDWKFLFKKIVLESCTTSYIKLPVACYNMHGVSTDKDTRIILFQEKEAVLKSVFPPLVMSDMQELYYLKGLKPVVHIMEIQKYKGLRNIMNGFVRIVLRGYQKIRGIKYK